MIVLQFNKIFVLVIHLKSNIHLLWLIFQLMPQSIFHQMLSRVGDQHRYQTLVNVCMGLIGFQLGITSFTNPFLFEQEQYTCSPQITNCQAYVCALPQSQQQQFLVNTSRKLVDRFGNYRCSVNGELNAAQAIIFAGGVVRVAAAALLLSRITQKPLLVGSLVLNIIGLTLTLLSPSLTMATVGLSLNFCGRYMQIGILYSFITESVGEAIRMINLKIIGVFIAAGPPIIGLGYWLIQPWELVYVLLTIVPQAINLFMVVVYIEEIPFDLLASKTADRALQGFKHISDFNGIEFMIERREVEAVQDEYRRNLEQKQHQNLSLKDLFCFKSLRMITILSITSRFFINCSYVIPDLYIRDYSFNFYASGVIMGLAEVVANFVGMFTFGEFARKASFYLFWAMGATTGLLLWQAVPCLDKQQCSSWQTAVQPGLLISYRFISCYVNFFFLVYQAGLFPTQVKGIAMQTLTLSATSSYIILPLLQGFYDRHHYSIFSCYFFLNFIIIAALWNLKETFQITPLSQSRSWPTKVMHLKVNDCHHVLLKYCNYQRAQRSVLTQGIGWNLPTYYLPVLLPHCSVTSRFR